MLKGQCTNPLVVPGTFPYVSFNLPSDVVVSEGATGYSISTQPGWVTMQSGDVCNGVTEQAITNYAGQSCFGTGQLNKTFKPGLNFSFLGPIDACTYNVARNWRLRLTNAFLLNGFTGYSIINLSWPNGIDAAGYPGLPGYWAIGFDDPLYATTPSTVTIQSVDTTLCTVTQITGNNNPGVNGQNQYYLFNVAYVSTRPSNNTRIGLQIEKGGTGGAIEDLNNLWIVGPSDFIVPAANDTTWSFDRTSNPYALSNTFLSNFANSCGSCRWLDSTLGFGAGYRLAYPWESTPLNSLSWNPLYLYSGNTLTYIAARPLVPPGVSGSTSYIYSQFLGSQGLGSSWTCSSTLGADITSTTQTTITFSSANSAADDPVFCGVLIQIDSEQMMVRSANGASITVFRGACGTTATTHSAGAAITILSKRWAWTSLDQLCAFQSGSQVNLWALEIVCSTPHGFSDQCNVSFGSGWPSLQMTNGGGIDLNTWNFYDNVSGPFITGPNTFALYAGVASSSNATLTTTTDVSISVNQNSSQDNGFPMEFIAMATGALPGADLHVNIPAMATDAYVWDVAAKIKANFPTGRRVYVELSDEPWNYGYSIWSIGYVLSGILGINYFYYYVAARTGQIRTIFRTVFGNRENEVYAVLNMQEGGTLPWVNPTSSSNLTTGLQAAAYCGATIDACAVANYIYPDSSSASTNAWNNSATIQQMLDLFIHDTYYNTVQLPLQFSQYNALIQGYNTYTGNHCVFYGYEGGIQGSPNGTPATLTIDIANDPLWVIAEQDFYALLQRGGYINSNLYSYNIYYVSNNNWGVYHGSHMGKAMESWRPTALRTRIEITLSLQGLS